MCTKQGKKMRESVVFKQHYPTPNAGWSGIRNVQQNPISQRLWGLLPLTSWDFYPHCLMLIRTLSDTYGGFWIASLSLTRTELSDITHSCNCSSERTGNPVEQTECLYGIYFLLTEQNLLDLGSISRMPQLVEQQAQVVCGWARETNFSDGYWETVAPSQCLSRVSVPWVAASHRISTRTSFLGSVGAEPKWLTMV